MKMEERCVYGNPTGHGADYRVTFWAVWRGKEQLVVRPVCEKHLDMLIANYHIKSIARIDPSSGTPG